MLPLTYPLQHYAWGSVDAIPDLLGVPRTEAPVAEAWLGAHPSAPAVVHIGTSEVPLDQLIAAFPTATLGAEATDHFGSRLPYLLKVLAAASPLSLQVHPSMDRARAGYLAEEAAGVPVTAPHRNYRDPSHKPELLYALAPFGALAGFRDPSHAAALFLGLDAPLARTLHDTLRGQPSPPGIRAALEHLLSGETRPVPQEVAAVVAACAARLAWGSPDPEADRTVLDLAAAYPGDPGAVTSLLLNRITLAPGEALFVPAGCVHTYLSGLGLEVMANSDNVLRAGLTPKHMDVAELLANVDYAPAPPTRVMPVVVDDAALVFRPQVEEFELSITTLADGEPHGLCGGGPRVLLCLDGEVTVSPQSGTGLTLTRGRAGFAPASDGTLTVTGGGTVVQVELP